ncbi:MAG: hypothetical protein OEW83_10545 [Acidimicrobiia bacterium]|nr:hypothetical protein [Acidimicrobiia bacterium]
MTNQITPRPNTTSPEPSRPAMTRSARGRRRAGLSAVVVAFALLATGCTGGPGDRDDFVDVLTRDDNFAVNEAECIADAVFDRYGEDGNALQKISAAETYDYLTGEDGVEGFGEFFDATVTDCTAIGPSADE